MSYQKQNFQKYNILRAAELNHIEDGIVANETDTSNLYNDVWNGNPFYGLRKKVLLMMADLLDVKNTAEALDDISFSVIEKVISNNRHYIDFRIKGFKVRVAVKNELWAMGTAVYFRGYGTSPASALESLYMTDDDEQSYVSKNVQCFINGTLVEDPYNKLQVGDKIRSMTFVQKLEKPDGEVRMRVIRYTPQGITIDMCYPNGGKVQEPSLGGSNFTTTKISSGIAEVKCTKLTNAWLVLRYDKEMKPNEWYRVEVIT